MLVEKTNFKFHKGNIITYTVNNGWIKDQLSVIVEGGWGNGYIGIPIGHPFLELIEEKIELNPLVDRKINITYYELNEHYPLEENYFTYSDIEEINGIPYYVFGFDTLHAGDNMNNWPESKVISTIEKYVQTVLKASQIN